MASLATSLHHVGDAQVGGHRGTSDEASIQYGVLSVDRAAVGLHCCNGESGLMNIGPIGRQVEPNSLGAPGVHRGIRWVHERDASIDE